MKKIILALAVLGLASASPAIADSHKDKKHEYTCHEKDCDHESHESECKGKKKGKKAKPDFTTMDTDKDGGLSLEEFIAAKTAKLEQKFKRIDTDESGSISEDELKEARKKKHAYKGEHKKH